ncbi:hypothetical protein Pan44_07920 [Caulifigura coniformis]|uniref:Uncharacterized protein n=1 Tax=Caulifigura coniformis TaxID=2527983 RepID=A0A517S9H8_9PLAN|nr:hypothetical protein [Caulifigura coniformis]QDT52780.1 hypothetical protein Pan44_07920 [Caulifigura coniformis]
MEIKLSVPDDVVDAVAKRFPDKNNKKAVAAAVAQLAFHDWADWLSAHTRHRTISAMHQARIRAIFAHPDLYAGKSVKRGTLFNQWNIPYGEASYIERVFAEMELPHLIRTALKAIKTELGEQLKEWGETPVEQREQTQQFTVEVDKYGQNLLQALMQDAKEQGLTMAPSERSSAVNGYYSYTFVVEEAKEVLVRCEQQLKRYE